MFYQRADLTSTIASSIILHLPQEATLPFIPHDLQPTSNFNPMLRLHPGFAFIHMDDERDAEEAIRELDRREFGRHGRRLRIEWTKQERGVRRPSGSRSSANLRPTKTLFVINFDPINTRTRDLERHFEPYGKVSNVRIRRNFAFIQYESLEDATRALDATNMSKLMDRVISVEYAVRDDDDRRNGHSPSRRGRERSRSHEKSRDRGQSWSPDGRAVERPSPDYGHGPSPYRRPELRGSPDYGRGSVRPEKSPDYSRGERRRGSSPDHGRDGQPKSSPDYGIDGRRKGSPDYDRVERLRGSSEHGKDGRRKDSSNYSRDERQKGSIDHTREERRKSSPRYERDERPRKVSPGDSRDEGPPMGSPHYKREDRRRESSLDNGRDERLPEGSPDYDRNEKPSKGSFEYDKEERCTASPGSDREQKRMSSPDYSKGEETKGSPDYGSGPKDSADYGSDERQIGTPDCDEEAEKGKSSSDYERAERPNTSPNSDRAESPAGYESGSPRR